MKKIIKALSIILLLPFLLVSCNGKSLTSKTDSSLPLNQREGYTTKYDGFKGVVHRVTNNENNNQIYGRIFLPDDFDQNKKYPLLIMSHGYNSVSMDGSSGMVKMAIKYNMLCYTFDFCGGGKMSKSDSTPKEMSVLTEMSDLNSVIDDLKTYSYINTDNIVLFGHSFGGLVTGMVSARRNDIKKVILHAPAFPIVYQAKDTYKSVDDIPDEIVSNNLIVSKKFYTDLISIDPYLEIKNFKYEVLLLYGDSDMFIDSVDDVKNAYNEVKTVVVSGAGHDFSNEHYLKIENDIYQYLNK